ncbi:twin-arginine translocation signal domain-containing protein [Streptomyces lydicus]
MSDDSARRTSLTRRALLTATAAAGLAAAAGLQPSHRIPAGSAAATLTPRRHPAFPTSLSQLVVGDRRRERLDQLRPVPPTTW